ncbi:uncharacterized protein PV09_04118 [Verruconis gallopava]|uniref:Uncharacterized protein n=1 Tax=Verruconis gallopava TaxID=253628 RepID=A0A0D2B0V0_9PEZI|nr:uncharacterized protein PV09_04118 [Verruconis gallopava]KIW04954.1 hypothetical protein PV09_04118 [Verruconis gallopava]
MSSLSGLDPARLLSFLSAFTTLKGSYYRVIHHFVDPETSTATHYSSDVLIIDDTQVDQIYEPTVGNFTRLNHGPETLAYIFGQTPLFSQAYV